MLVSSKLSVCYNTPDMSIINTRDPINENKFRNETNEVMVLPVERFRYLRISSAGYADADELCIYCMMDFVFPLDTFRR